MGVSPAGAKRAERVLSALTERRDELVDAFAYAVSDGRDPARLGDVREAAKMSIDVILVAMTERRALTREDVVFARPYFRHAMLRGASEADLLRSCRQMQRVAWQFLDDLAGVSAAGRAVVAELSRPLIDYVEVFSEIAAETFAEVQAAISSSRHPALGRLLDDLLAGRAVEEAGATEAARRAGLGDATALVVISATPTQPETDEGALVLAAATLSRAAGDTAEPIFAVRAQEVVVVRAMRDDAERYVDALDAARKRLRPDGIRLAVGVSAVHYGLSSVPRAYQEAWMARERVDSDGGMIALARMAPFDYLLLRAGDATAWRLVPERIRRFVDDDLAQAGLLIDTLMAYVDANLNAKLAAERLYVHPNTAHYRLGKIAEITGCDLRAQADLMQLVVAVALARRR
jgi:hypothetical protein